MINLVKEKTINLISNTFASYLLVGLIFVSAGLYVYFANAAVRTLTALEKTKEETQSLSVEVSEMEAKRLLVDNKITNVVAKTLGFIEVTNQNFIVGKSKKATLSFNTD